MPAALGRRCMQIAPNSEALRVPGSPFGPVCEEPDHGFQLRYRVAVELGSGQAPVAAPGPSQGAREVGQGLGGGEPRPGEAAGMDREAGGFGPLVPLEHVAGGHGRQGDAGAGWDGQPRQDELHRPGGRGG